MSLRIILNPRAGSGSAARGLPRLKAALDRRSLDYTIVETQGPGDASRLAREAIADGVERLGVVGGDGTLNEASQAYIDSQGEAVEGPKLGLIPFGTGGDFRKTFGLTRDLEAAVARLIDSPGRPVDLGSLSVTNADGEPSVEAFLNITSFGIGGLTDQLVNAGPKWLGGKAAFLLGTVRALAAYRNVPVTVAVDGKPFIEGPILNVAIANGQFFGGGMHIAPDAEPDDGLFDVVALCDLTRATAVGLTQRIYAGTHLTHGGVRHTRGKLVEAAPVFPFRHALIDMDGETPGRLPLTARVLPGAVVFLA